MKKHSKFTVVVSLFLVLLLFSTSCFSLKKIDNNPFVGFWTAVRAHSEETGTMDLAKLGISYTLEISEDGSAELAFFDEVSNGKWVKSGKGIDLTCKDMSDDVIYCYIENDELVLELFSDSDETFYFTKSSSGKPPRSTTARDTTIATTEKPANTASINEGTIGDYYVRILDSKLQEGDDGETLLVQYFEYTNNSNEEQSFFFTFNYYAYQDKSLLSTGSLYEAADENYNIYSAVRPGESIIVCEYYVLKNREDITIEVIEFLNYDDDAPTVIKTVSYDSLTWIEIFVEPPTTEPTEATAPVSVDAVEGEIGEYYVKILNAEIVEGDEGETLLAQYYEFTNLSDEDQSFFFAMIYYAYQDGNELEFGYLYDSAPENDDLFTDIAPGESIIICEYFVLESDSDITVLVWEFMNFDEDQPVLEKTFTLASIS